MIVKNRTEIIFEIKENIGIIATYPSGWSKELNLVSWNGADAKYDLRDWDSEHKHMSRGLTFTEDEAKELYEMLKNRFE